MTEQRLRTAISAFLIGTAVGCSGSPTQPAQDGRVRVAGSVRDFRSDAAIGGARVTIGSAVATTGASGLYSLAVLAGEATVDIDGESIGAILIKGPTYRGDFYVHTAGCIARYGTVVDTTTRRPIQGARVSLAGTSVVTDDTGWFRLSLGCPPPYASPFDNPACVGFNTIFLTLTHPSYRDGSFVAGRGVCFVQRVDYELLPR